MGVLRVLLALTVLNWHCNVVSAKWSFLNSASSVIVFFMISGFYMAMVITERYGTSVNGLAKFYSNRALRLYPSYLVVLVVGQVAGLFSPLGSGFAVAFNQILIFPHALWANATLHVDSANFLVLGQMYTVALEIMFYAIAPLIVTRRLWMLILLFCIAAAYQGVMWHSGAAPRVWQYDFFPGVIVYFLAGILAYRLYTVVRTWNYPASFGYAALPLIIFAGWLTTSASVGTWTNDPIIFAYYALCAVAIPFLFIATKNSKADRFIGDLSYPLYIVHIAILIAIVVRLPDWNGAPAAGATMLGLSAIFALFLTLFVDRPLERLREEIAAKKKRVRLMSGLPASA